MHSFAVSHEDKVFKSSIDIVDRFRHALHSSETENQRPKTRERHHETIKTNERLISIDVKDALTNGSTEPVMSNINGTPSHVPMSSGVAGSRFARPSTQAQRRSVMQ